MDKLIKECHKIAKSKGFWDNPRNVGEMLMLITSELGEAMEAHRKGKFANWEHFEKIKSKSESDFNHLYHNENFESRQKVAFEHAIKDSFEDEIADAVIRLFDLVGGLNIDLEKHINEKLKYNKTRDKFHGKNY